ncbi:ComEC/Rec2 family competence protein [Polaromonas sp.]|uniref:ComEC/Rec2 family competence protein n=1 Tax=Polaromonas sp. TaxID=1869339 RepID=UPI002FC8FF34
MTQLVLRLFDVEHGACAIMAAPTGERIAMVDSGHNSSTGWRPSTYIQNTLGRKLLDFLFVTNADQDHLSDLDGLWDAGVELGVLIRNPGPSPEILRKIKVQQGGLTNDIERFLAIHKSFNVPPDLPFNSAMGGVTCSTFHNSYPDFKETNNLSMAVFIKYGPFKILFPGDLEAAGWRRLLNVPSFVQELAGTTVLVASHHGRLNGFASEVFDYFAPQCVVISDKPIIHATQEMVPDYRSVTQGGGIAVLNQTSRRQVLTTRTDGDIIFKVNADGVYTIETTRNGR